MDTSPLPRFKHELVAHLIRRCESFTSYWKEVDSIYSGKDATQVPADDALWEFARHSLELFQDSKNTELTRIVDAVCELMSCYNDNTRDLGVELLGMIEHDWVTQMSGGQENFEKWFRKAIQLE